MKNKNEGIVLVYVLFLAGMSILFATILLSNNSYLFNISKHFEINSEIEHNIDIDSKIIIDINRSLNLNGTGFIDNMSCPDGATITMSGNTVISNTGSFLTNDGTDIYCYATHNSIPLYIFFNSDFTDFSTASYDGYSVSLIGGIATTLFGDSDSTSLDFSAYNYFTPDGFDDNYNSDNYAVTSTGNSFSGTYYNDFVEDDDVLGRKTLIGYVSSDVGFKNIFWNTTKTTNIIRDNENNSDPLNVRIGNITDGTLHFDIDNNYSIKLLKFSKTTYDNTNELKGLDAYNSTNFAGVGYLQSDMTLSSAKTGSEYSFDFSNYDYAIFLKSTSNGALLYGMKGENISDGKGIYIIPIDDSGTGSVTYLGNEILISNDGAFSHKHIKKIYTK